MLTFSKPLSAGQAQSYHKKEYTSREQNYWSRRGEMRGEWQGRLAEQFGLRGPVSEQDFARLSQGQQPQTGVQLVRQRASYQYQDADGKSIRTMEHRAGWDATFSAPKSVSLTALVGGDYRVREAHREAVTAALHELERYTQARIGSNHPPETTGKFIAAKFEHDTARPVDGYVAPQLHTHAVLFNLTERDNGETRAIQPQSLFASQQFATAIYQSELTYRLRQLGYEIAAGRSGAPEIKGYTQEYLDASSPRSQQIREYLERTGKNGKEAAEIAAHSTRDRKEIHSTAEVMAAHRKLAAEFGHQAEAVVRAAQERMHHQEQRVSANQSQERVRESLTFARDRNFEREAVVDERLLVRDALRRGMGEITYSQVRAHLESRMAIGEFQTLERRQNSPARQFTTARTIREEQEIISQMRAGKDELAPVLSQQQAVTFAAQHSHLNQAQRRVVEDVLNSPDRIQGIQGVAGAGKTTIQILAPMIGYRRRKNDAEQEPSTQPDAKPAPMLIGFRAVYVFDISQTEGADLPELDHAITGEVGEYRDHLIAFLNQQNITLEFNEKIAPALGVSYGGKIVLLPGQSKAEEFTTLVHETAHELLHKAERRTITTQTVRETEAEAVAFIVGQAVGLELGTSSADYIQLYHGNAALLAESLEVIQRTSAVILAALRAEEPENAAA
ncbi:MAG: MobF family relaxase [Acidobacteriaceae bacterium]